MVVLKSSDLKREGHAYEEEDSFYKQLERQILVLIEEDDGDKVLVGTNKHCRNNNKQGRLRNINSSSTIRSKYENYFNWCSGESTSDVAVPNWLLKLWTSTTNGKGTGVFIPHIVKSRTRIHGLHGRGNNGRRMYI